MIISSPASGIRDCVAISVIEEDKYEEDLGVYTSIADSGKEISRYFCKTCGSPIMTLHPHIPEYAWVKAGIIDQTEQVQPAHESWTSRKVPWAEMVVEKSVAGNRG